MDFIAGNSRALLLYKLLRNVLQFIQIQSAAVASVATGVKAALTRSLPFRQSVDQAQPVEATAFNSICVNCFCQSIWCCLPNRRKLLSVHQQQQQQKIHLEQTFRVCLCVCFSFLRFFVSSFLFFSSPTPRLFDFRGEPTQSQQTNH